MNEQIHLLQPGIFLHWHQQIFQLVNVDWKTLQIEAEAIEGRKSVRFEMQELWGNLNEQAPIFASTLPELHQAMKHLSPAHQPISEQGLPQALLAKASFIITVVETTQQQLAEITRRAHLRVESVSQAETLRTILQTRQRPVGLTSYYKYRKLYEQYDGDRVRIAAALRRSTFGQTRMSRAQLHLVDQIILRYGARRPPRTPKVLYELIASTLERTHGFWVNPDQGASDIPEKLVQALFDHHIPLENILSNTDNLSWLSPVKLPSQSWFYTYFRWFQKQPELGRGVVNARYGREVWEREMLVFDSFAHLATMPLQYVFADHWLIDVFTVDDATRQQRSRLWLTVLIDAYSRCILGMSLLDQAPSIQSIQTALRHAIWLKSSHTELGVDANWSCFGIPQQLFLDNAWAHHAYSLEDLARSISQRGQYTSIDLVFRPPYRGRYGALIERFFGNLSARMKTELKGAIVSSQPTEIRRAAHDAVLLYKDINRFIHQEILFYQHRPHPELDGMTPHEKWSLWMANAVPRIPPLTDAMKRLFWRMEADSRVLTAQGISAFGMQYSSPELSQAQRINRQGQRVQYYLRYNPDDISRIALFQDGEWFCDVYAKPLRLPDGSYRKISLAQRRLAQAALRQQGQSGRNWLQYINEHETLFRQRLHEQQLASQNQTPQTHTLDVYVMQTKLADLDDTDREAELAQLLGNFLSGDNPHES